MNQEQTGDSPTKIRAFGIILILFEIGMLFAYGFGADLVQAADTTPKSDYSGLVLAVVLAAVVAIMGYGLLLAYSYNSALAGLVTTLLGVVVTVQLAPLLLTFWDQVFNGFNDRAQLTVPIMRSTFVLCASLFVALTILVGRLGLFETVIMIIFYNIGWTLAFEVNKYLLYNKAPTSPITYDDYGTGYIFIFAGYFALVASIFISCKIGKSRPHTTNTSAAFGLIGTGVIFAFFPFTGILEPKTITVARAFEGPLNIYFTLVTSTICTYISSAIFGGGKTGIR